jgi:hypothetical protein
MGFEGLERQIAIQVIIKKASDGGSENHRQDALAHGQRPRWVHGTLYLKSIDIPRDKV